MRRFLCNVAGFGAIQAAILGALLFLYPGQDNTYLAATIDKHRTAESMPGERILIVGGSNASFGTDSRAIHEQLGRHPINLGLHAGLGLDFMLNEAREVMRPGDVVLLNLEYQHLLMDATDLTIMQLLEYRPQSVEYLTWSQRKRLLDYGLVYLRKVIGKSTKPRKHDDQPGYGREEFNEYGDVIGHHTAVSLYAHAGAAADWGPVDGRYVASAVAKLNQFARQCRDQNIDVFYVHPAIAQNVYEASSESIDYVDQAVSSWVQIPVLNSAAEMVYPNEMFYDTPYHLLLEGKQRKTALMIDRLVEKLEPSAERLAGPAPQSTRR